MARNKQQPTATKGSSGDADRSQYLKGLAVNLARVSRCTLRLNGQGTLAGYKIAPISSIKTMVPEVRYMCMVMTNPNQSLGGLSSTPIPERFTIECHSSSSRLL